ncbi:hypothetical protein [Bacillus massiliigorillae]|uniref:hypothetical protein n=1 Tax=Bacillus massiliigorillae TaxID=1243664 RepID=UPI0012B5DC6D|nr:hypothetical protein [Bacillus massiliigorillae]
MTDLSSSIIEENYPKSVINNPKVTINRNTIHVQFDLHNSFEQMEPLNQFTTFELFNKHLRFLLLTKESEHELYGYNVTLSASSNNHTFEYVCKLPNKYWIHGNESYLSMNENVIYTSSEFKKVKEVVIDMFPVKKINGYNDYEIFEYSRRFFTAMTKGGKYYNPKTDNSLIVDAVMDKFRITAADFSSVYQKYFLLY